MSAVRITEIRAREGAAMIPLSPPRSPQAPRQSPPPPVSDADLLEACRAGTRHARRLYARACAEWRDRYQEAERAASRPEAERIVREAVREVDEAMWVMGLVRLGLGGSRG